MGASDESVPQRFEAPRSLKQRFTCSTEFEASNLMATYVLFRLCSDEEVHHVLAPPLREYLWNGDFAKIKAQDIKDGKQHLYDSNPFRVSTK
jgi:hypothetical protein